MGYTTEFRGSFIPNKVFTQEQTEYLNKFSDTRRMKRDTSKLILLEPNLKNGFNGTYGIDGEFYIGDDNKGLIDHNLQPSTQPSLWCQWIMKDGELQWDNGEKFYFYVEWLQYIIDNFLTVWDIKLNGNVEYWGERNDDFGTIYVRDNIIEVVDEYELLKKLKQNRKNK
jgi:hypothetical protein